MLKPTILTRKASKPIAYIVYLDANNLYGWDMIQFLPTGGFIFISPQIVTRLPADNIAEAVCALPDDGGKVYILEIDAEYPEEFHDKHSDYRLTSEILEISNDMLSPLQKATFPKEPPQKKLTPNLRNKNNYIVHYRNLKM